MQNITENSFTLSIRIHADGFSLSVSEKAGSEISTKNISAPILSLPTEELVDLISRETQLNYQHISLVYESDTYMFVPTVFFKPEDATYYLNHQHKVKNTEQILHNSILAWDTVNIFSVPATLYQAVAQLFPKLTIEHQMTPLLANKVKPQPENALYVLIRQKMFDVIVIKNGKLQLLNSYAYQTPEDFVYHTLNVVEQLSININHIMVFLYNPLKKMELEKLLENYVRIRNCSI